MVTASRLKRDGPSARLSRFPVLRTAAQAVFFLELKRDGSGMSEEQIAVHAHLMACGFGYLCTNSFDEAVGDTEGARHRARDGERMSDVLIRLRAAIALESAALAPRTTS